MTKNTDHFTITLPDWTIEETAKLPTHFETPESRMDAVIEFSRKNFQHGTGGPFAAGVFEKESGKLIVIGVNRVMPSNCSSAHAEVVALSLAQKKLGDYDLGGEGMPEHQLVVNWRPCVMCYGAVHWSGIRSLVIAGDGPELEEITGFNEGPIHPDWENELKKLGVEVVKNVLREKAIAAYEEYAASDPFVYNARQG